jgi:hypothetical protein
MDVPYSMARHFQWESWWAHGYREADLHCVIAYLLEKIRAGHRFLESLKFSNLIGNTERFAEDLSVARAWNRANSGRPDPARTSILKQTNRHADQFKDTVRSAEQVIKGDQALKQLLALRDKL